MKLSATIRCLHVFYRRLTQASSNPAFSCLDSESLQSGSMFILQRGQGNEKELQQTVDLCSGGA